MNSIVLKATESCRWDCVSLGEVMLRLDPGEERIHTARTLGILDPGRRRFICLGLIYGFLAGKDAQWAVWLMAHSPSQGRETRAWRRPPKSRL